MWLFADIDKICWHNCAKLVWSLKSYILEDWNDVNFWLLGSLHVSSGYRLLRYRKLVVWMARLQIICRYWKHKQAPFNGFVGSDEFWAIVCCFPACQIHLHRVRIEFICLPKNIRSRNTIISCRFTEKPSLHAFFIVFLLLTINGIL